MLKFLNRLFRSEKAEGTTHTQVDDSRIEEFYMGVAQYAASKVGEDQALRILESLEHTCHVFSTPESTGLPNRGRLWETLADQDSGENRFVVVFLDVAPMDAVVREFFHNALPVIEQIQRESGSKA